MALDHDPSTLDDPQLEAMLAFAEALADGGDPEAGDAADAPGKTLDLSGETGKVLRMLEGMRPRSGPERVGKFTIQGELGRGGFGIVFLALDPELGRKVALKLPRPELLGSALVRRRFVREARAAAVLDHPNLVPVFEASEIGPLIYIASAYCEGTTLAAWLKSRGEPAPVRLAAALAATLADAVQHAHDRGVWHRDLKPSNVLLQKLAAPPIDAAEIEGLGYSPRITDFGLAKAMLAEGEEETGSGIPMGTPPYMAPEQAAGRVRDVGPATDIYALGAILYEVLTGRPPFQGETPMETLGRVLADEPIPPRTLRPGLHRDLETIVLACLRKDPAHRYASARELAADLRNFLRGLPIRARRTSPWRQGFCWLRRRPAAAAAGALIATAVLALFSAGLWYNAKLREGNAALNTANDLLKASLRNEQIQRGRAESYALRVRRFLYAGELRTARRELDHGDIGLAARRLDEQRSSHGEPDLRDFAWCYLRRSHRGDYTLLANAPDELYALAISPDGRFLAWGGRDRVITVRDMTDPDHPVTLKGHKSWVVGAVFAGNGALASVGAGGSLPRGEVRFWDIPSGKDRGPTIGRTVVGQGLAVSPDGRTLAWPRGKSVALLEIATGRIRATDETSDVVTGVAFAPNGATLATGSQGGWITIWDIASGHVRMRLPAPGHETRELAFSPDGRTLAEAKRQGTVRLCDAVTGREIWSLRGAPPGLAVAFSPDGKSLAMATGPVVRIVDPANGQERARVDFGIEAVRSLVYSPRGDTLYAVGISGGVVAWRPEGAAAGPRVRGHDEEVWAVAFTADGKTIITAGDDHLIKFWDRQTGQERATLAGHGALVTSLSVSHDGRTLASGSFDGSVRLWDLPSGRHRTVFWGHPTKIRAVAFSPDGQTLASAGSDHQIVLWDLPSGVARARMRGHESSIHALAFSPDGRSLASAGDTTVRVWDVAHPERLPRLLHCSSKVLGVVYSPDGRMIVSGDAQGDVTAWDPITDQKSSFRSNARDMRALAFSRDGKTLATAGSTGTVALWDPATAQELLTLQGPPHQVSSLAFAPDGRTLASGSHDGSVTLWHTEPP
jgi:WD40 repeat protein/serine/threonine protein kinase